MKNPAWLNDPLLYHNRGNTSFSGENSLYGDFFGLDDLWTERREVVEGMIDIYSFWIEEFGVDGFRIDTTKHVNMEFWQVFGPEILARAAEEGIEDFFAFGEVFDQTFGPQFMSEFSTRGQLQSTIDFGFQLAARGFASQSAPTDNLADFFALDDWYTDTDSNAYGQPTFLGNHDMGRIGHFLQRVDQIGASDSELLARSALAHALMFTARGSPVIYYGDEQGFTGDGGDKDAREDMFANRVPSYEDNDLIGTRETTSNDNFDRDHPLFETIEEWNDLYERHDALRSGAQIHRYSSTGPGIYAFSRYDRDERIEYVVALNNSEAPATAAIPTFASSGARFRLVNDDLVPRRTPERLTAGAGGALTITVPALSAVVYEADRRVPRSQAAPGIEITSLTHGQTVPLETSMMDGQEVVDRIEVGAELDSAAYAEVTFAVRVGAGEWTPIGTDDNAPYRVFYDASALRDAPQPLTFRAIVNDLNGHLDADQVGNITADFPEPGGPATPYAVIHYNRPAGDYGDHTAGSNFWGLHLWGNGIAAPELTDWTTPKPFLGEDEYGRFAFVQLTDDTVPLNFIVHQGDTKDPDNSPDRSFVPGTTPEIWLRQGDVNVYTSQAAALGAATVRFGCGTACGAVALNGAPPTSVDDYGALWQVRAGRRRPGRAADGDDHRRRYDRRRRSDVHAGGRADGVVRTRRPDRVPVTRRGRGLRHDPLPPPRRRLRRPHQRQLQRLLGPPRLGGRGGPDGVGEPGAPDRHRRVRHRVPRRPRRRSRPARVHPPPRRRQGPRPRPVPRVRPVRPRGLAAPGREPRAAVRRPDGAGPVGVRRVGEEHPTGPGRRRRTLPGSTTPRHPSTSRPTRHRERSRSRRAPTRTSG